MSVRLKMLRNRTNQWIIFVLLLVMIVHLPYCSEKKSESLNTNLQSAPDFILTDLNGRSGRLSDYRGKVIILDFWATWCAPCRLLIPLFKDLYSKYRDSGFEVIGVAMDRGGEKVVKPFVEKHEIDYPNFIGNQEVVRNYGGLRGIPTTFVITKEGRIYKKYVGVPPNPLSVFETDVKSLLSL